MKEKIKVEMPMAFFEELVSYVELACMKHRPDPQDMDATLRIHLMSQLRTRLLKRRAEVLYAPKLKLTVPKVEALALTAYFMAHLEPNIITAQAVRRITDKAHQEWA